MVLFACLGSPCCWVSCKAVWSRTELLSLVVSFFPVFLCFVFFLSHPAFLTWTFLIQRNLSEKIIIKKDALGH